MLAIWAAKDIIEVIMLRLFVVRDDDKFSVEPEWDLNDIS